MLSLKHISAPHLQQSWAPHLNAARAIHNVSFIRKIFHREEERCVREIIIERRVPNRVSCKFAALAISRGNYGVGKIGELLGHVYRFQQRVESTPVVAGSGSEQMLRFSASPTTTTSGIT